MVTGTNGPSVGVLRRAPHPRNGSTVDLYPKAEEARRVSISVFLLDDHEIVRRGIGQLLEIEDDIEVVGEAGTAAQAMAALLDGSTAKLSPKELDRMAEMIETARKEGR